MPNFLKRTLFCILFPLVVTRGQKIGEARPFIEGGGVVDGPKYPFFAKIYYLDYGFGIDYHLICGGAILTPTRVLTAAHCTYGKSLRREILVVTGDFTFSRTDEKDTRFSVKVDRGLELKKYHDLRNGWDLIILELEKNITFNKYRQPIELCARQNLTWDKLKKDHKIMGMGFGQESTIQGDLPEKMKEMEFLYTDTKYCWNGSQPYPLESIDCFVGTYNGSEACQRRGDSGSPGVIVKRDTEEPVCLYSISSRSKAFSCFIQIHMHLEFFWANYIGPRIFGEPPGARDPDLLHVILRG